MGLLKGSRGPRANDSRHLLDVHRRALPGRDAMRSHRDDDEVDLCIVGAGAGGSVLAQRLARRGWRIVILEAGPFWDPDEDWVSDEAGSHELYWTQKRIIGGRDPVELGKNNSGRGWAARWSTTPATRRASTPRILPPAPSTGSAPTGRSPTETCSLTTRRSSGSSRSLARTGRGATRTPIRSRLTRSVAPRPCSGRARLRRASRCAWARSGSSMGPLATGRTASTVATACRGARSTRRRAHT